MRKISGMIFACGLTAVMLCACGEKQSPADISAVVDEEYESSQPEATDAPVESDESDTSAALKESVTGELPPMITAFDGNFVAAGVPVDELPDGYAFVGEVDSEMADDTGLTGCKMYAFTDKYGFDRLYLYQEWGTPTDENTIDTEKRQWAYVPWIREGSSE